MVALIAIAWVVSASRGAGTPSPEQRELENYLNEAEAKQSALEARNPRFVGWRYSTERDQMRGLNTRRADLLADNYDPQRTPTLSIWRRSDGQAGAQLSPATADVGWITCSPGSRTFAVKIDDQPVRELRCDQTTSVIFEPRFVTLIHGSRRVMIEVEGAYGGRTQFTFQTAGLSL